MKAACVLKFGTPVVITIDDLPRPKPSSRQLLVHVRAAGVGPWDALVREGKSALKQPLPLILGSELSGIVEAVGEEVAGFKPGDEVYGATNETFTGAYVEYALASAEMMADKPKKLTHIEAASSPIGAVSAWQMLFDYAHATTGQTVLIHGAAGNKTLGADQVVDYRRTRFEDSVSGVDIVLDTVGGDTQERSLPVLKPGGILVSVVSKIPEEAQHKFGVRAAYFYVEVTSGRLNKIAELFDEGTLVPHVATVLPLADARTAHEMLGGAPTSVAR
jgi:NADPH:quinone reductase-like Zn-dependent oxidoreductase